MQNNESDESDVEAWRRVWRLVRRRLESKEETGE